jgi:hypothetical protein
MSRETEAAIALAKQKEVYMTIMRKRLALIAREYFDRSIGGPENVEEYRVRCHQLKKVKNMGELLHVAHEMKLDVPTVVRLVLQPYLGVDRNDFVNAPEKWEA